MTTRREWAREKANAIRLEVIASPWIIERDESGLLAAFQWRTEKALKAERARARRVVREAKAIYGGHANSVTEALDNVLRRLA